MHSSSWVLAGACLLALVAAGSKTPDTAVYELFVFPEGCLNKFLAFEIDPFCVKKTISKVLGYGIITGACVVKLPQILAFVRAGSVAGISREATYLELLGYLLGSIYHIVQGNPFSAYGETVIVTVQTAAIVLMLWAYEPPGVGHMFGVTSALAVIASQAYAAPASMLPLVMNSTIALFIASRGWQIFANWRAGSTGELAFLTLFMNAAGAAARIFTSLQEVKQIEVLVSFVISTVLNVGLLGQYVYYNLIAAGGKKGGAKGGKKVGASAKPANLVTAEPAAAGGEEKKEPEAPASASFARRRRVQA